MARYTDVIGHKDALALNVEKRDVQRFHAKWAEVDGCWFFQSVNKYGYGTFYIKNTPVVAHRFSKIMHDGPAPFGHYAAHECRHKRCVNPRHTSWKTPEQNSADRRRDRTIPSSEQLRSHAKFDAETARTIWKRYHDEHEAATRLAAEHGVNKATIYAIAKRRTYKHATAGLAQRPIPNDGVTVRRGAMSPFSKLNDSAVMTIREKMIEGVPHTQLAKKYGLRLSTLTAIRNCRTWKHLLPSNPAKRASFIASLHRIRNWSAKLDLDKVQRIKDALKAGETVLSISEALSIAPSTIKDIKAKRTWREV